MVLLSARDPWTGEIVTQGVFDKYDADYKAEYASSRGMKVEMKTLTAEEEVAYREADPLVKLIQTILGGT